MKIVTLVVISLISGAVSASSLCPLTEKGDLQLPFGYEITSKQSKKEFDLISIGPSKDNPYGGARQVWKLTKDSQGRIIRIESGLTQPTSQFVQFEIERRKHEQKNKEVFKEGSRNIVPTLSDLNKISFDPVMKPIKYGGSIEMTHDSGVCTVTSISEKTFDPAQKTSLETSLYNETYCPKVMKAFAEVSRQAQECSDRSDRFNQILADIRNQPSESMVANSALPASDRLKTTYLTSGAGGGGGSPMIGRSIASITPIEETHFDVSAHLMISSSNSLSLKEVNKLCEIRSVAEIRRISNDDLSPTSKARSN